MNDLPSQIFAQIVGDLFDQPVISNLFRPHYVERMIAIALGEGFELVSADWANWDIETSEGVRIEVKHAAAWQTWSDVTGEPKPSNGVFDISARTGHWADSYTMRLSRPKPLNPPPLTPPHGGAAAVSARSRIIANQSSTLLLRASMNNSFVIVCSRNVSEADGCQTVFIQANDPTPVSGPDRAMRAS